jgi:hypothetical protein
MSLTSILTASVTFALLWNIIFYAMAIWATLPIQVERFPLPITDRVAAESDTHVGVISWFTLSAYGLLVSQIGASWLIALAARESFSKDGRAEAILPFPALVALCILSTLYALSGLFGVREGNFSWHFDSEIQPYLVQTLICTGALIMFLYMRATACIRKLRSSGEDEDE